MRSLKKFIPIMCIAFMLFLVQCEKVNPDLDIVNGQDNETEYPLLKSVQISSSEETELLLSLIGTIESMLLKGQINRGNANALIVKIENAIKSLDRGNDNAAEGQLNAFTSQTESLIEAGRVPAEEGEDLINRAETGILSIGGSITDPRDGIVYELVLIGERLWIAENLKATEYNDGTDIPLETDKYAWGTLTTPAYCWYENDPETYGKVYGALYNWFVVETGDLCPEGWHVPTSAEWTHMIDHVGGISIAGGKLKEAGTEHWLSPNTDASNESGFSGLPGGHRSIYHWDNFLGLGQQGHWWNATEYSPGSYGKAYSWRMFHDAANVFTNDNYKRAGMSVRCVKD